MENEKETKYIDTLVNLISLGKRKESLFNWNILLVFIGPLLAILTLFLLRITNTNQIPKVWNWIIFLVFIPWIACSLIISQMKKLVGNYGETILILIPTFVWLLAGHNQAIKWLVIISGIVAFLGSLSYLIAIFRKVNINSNIPIKKRWTSILINISFVFISVVSTVSLSVILLDWGNNALQIAKIGLDGNPNYTSTSWILFISLITVSVALLLVFLGLFSNFKVTNLENNSYSDQTLKKKNNFKSQLANKKLLLKWKIKTKWYKWFKGNKWKEKKK